MFGLRINLFFVDFAVAEEDLRASNVEDRVSGGEFPSIVTTGFRSRYPLIFFAFLFLCVCVYVTALIVYA